MSMGMKEYEFLIQWKSDPMQENYQITKTIVDRAKVNKLARKSSPKQ